MAKYLVGEVDNHETIEARGISDAVKRYVDTHADDGWSDHFDVSAREEDDDQWQVFAVSTRTELIVTVGRSRLGAMVESDDSEAAE